MRSFGPDCARGLDVRTQKSSSPVASASGVTGTSKEAGLAEPRQCGDREARSRALTTLVEAVHNAPADVGSIPTVSTFSPLMACDPLTYSDVDASKWAS